jgi:hypothetical protein
VKIRPSLLPSQAHEASLWCERHANPDGTKDVDKPVKVVWSAGPKHDVVVIENDPAEAYEAIFSYYGPMLVKAEITFPDEYVSVRYVYVRSERDIDPTPVE